MKRLILPLLAAAFVCTLTAARAQTPAFAPVVGTSGYINDSSVTEGYSFSVTALTLVTGLGFYDYQQNGLASSHQVGLWNSAGVLLASLTIPSGTSAPLIGTSRYLNLTTPVTLAIGTTYTMGAFMTQNDPAIFFGTANPTAGVTYGQSLYNESGNFVRPTSTLGEDAAYFGPNLLVAPAQPAPEPSTWAFVVAGAGLLGFAARRRRAVRA